MATLHQTDIVQLPVAFHALQNLVGPWSGGIDQKAGMHGLTPAGFGIFQCDRPALPVAACGNDFGSGADLRATISGIAGGERHKTCVIHPAIRIFKSLGEKRLQRFSGLIGTHIERMRGRQFFAPTQMIVKKQAKSQQPGRTHTTLVIRQHETHRMDDMGCIGPQHLALHQRLTHQPEFIMFQIAQAAMNELGGARRGAACQIVHLGQPDGEAPPHRIACNAAAIDAAADDENVELFFLRHGNPRRPVFENQSEYNSFHMKEKRK